MELRFRNVEQVTDLLSQKNTSQKLKAVKSEQFTDLKKEND